MACSRLLGAGGIADDSDASAIGRMHETPDSLCRQSSIEMDNGSPRRVKLLGEQGLSAAGHPVWLRSTPFEPGSRRHKA